MQKTITPDGGAAGTDEAARGGLTGDRAGDRGDVVVRIPDCASSFCASVGSDGEASRREHQ